MVALKCSILTPTKNIICEIITIMSIYFYLDGQFMYVTSFLCFS